MAGHYNPSDKLKMQDWARALLRQPTFFVLDTETTGISKTDEIVQLGIIDQSGAAVLHTYIQPTQPISSGAQAVNQITPEMLRDAPPFVAIYVQLSALLAGQTVIAYNMDFDWQMLAQTAQRYGLPNIRTGERHCAMKAYAKFKGQYDLKRRSYRWYKLAEACKQQRIPPLNTHDALGDVRLTLALIRKMAE